MSQIDGPRSIWSGIGLVAATLGAMATPFDLTLDPEALALVRRKGGTAAIDFIPPIS